MDDGQCDVVCADYQRYCGGENTFSVYLSEYVIIVEIFHLIVYYLISTLVSKIVEI